MWRGSPAEARSLSNLGSSHGVENRFVNYERASLLKHSDLGSTFDSKLGIVFDYSDFLRISICIMAPQEHQGLVATLSR